MTTESMTTRLTTDTNPISLIQQAIDSKADPAYLRELLAVRREWEADEARKAYFSAVTQFQQEAPIIEKGDDAHGKKYARLDRIWRTIRPLVAKLGLAVTWQRCEIKDGLCHIEGRLTHVMGHSEAIVADTALPELIRGQNAAQQVGSAETYAKRRALCSALGLVTGDDDDGHGAGVATITSDQAAELAALIKTANDLTAQDDLLKWAGVSRIADLPADKFKPALKALKAKQ